MKGLGFGKGMNPKPKTILAVGFKVGMAATPWLTKNPRDWV